MDNASITRTVVLAVPSVAIVAVGAIVGRGNPLILSIFAIMLSLILVTLLLLQVRGSNLNVLGDAETSFRARRGLERWLFWSTIFVTADFLIIAILNVAFS